MDAPPPDPRDHGPTNLKPLNPGAESGGEAYAHDDDRDGVLGARGPQPRECVGHRLFYPNPDPIQYGGLVALDVDAVRVDLVDLVGELARRGAGR